MTHSISGTICRTVGTKYSNASVARRCRIPSVPNPFETDLHRLDFFISPGPRRPTYASEQYSIDMRATMRQHGSLRRRCGFETAKNTLR